MENPMEHEDLQMQEPEQTGSVYTPRPKWQIALAWLGIGIVSVGFVLYLIHIATAGGI